MRRERWSGILSAFQEERPDNWLHGITALIRIRGEIQIMSKSPSNAGHPALAWHQTVPWLIFPMACCVERILFLKRSSFWSFKLGYISFEEKDFTCKACTRESFLMHI